MAKQIDVYRDWLGITEPARPLDHYLLLKLKRFEDSVEKIRSNYRQLNAHVRKYAAGEFGPRSQALLNELAKAMLCLTDSQRKAEYDATHGRTTKQEGGRRAIELILLASKVITQDQLAKARKFSDAVGLPLRDTLLQQRMAEPEVIMQAFAESEGLPYLDLADIEPDAELIPKVPIPTARQHLCIPVMVDDNTLLMASPNPLSPDVEDDLRLRFGIPIRTVLCTPAAANARIAQFYTKEPSKPVKAKRGAAVDGDDEEEGEASSGGKLFLPKEKWKRQAGIAYLAAITLVIVYIAYKIITGR
jgi:hypothetical protein